MLPYANGTNDVDVGGDAADVLTETGTVDGRCEPWGYTDAVAGMGRTAPEAKTSLHCDWAANAGIAARLSRSTKLHHIIPKGRAGEGGRNL